MLKDITLGQYFPGTSFVHRLDPRTKLISVVLYIVALFCAKSWISYGVVLAFLLAEKGEDGAIPLRGTRDELASRLSVSRAALYRELSALQSGGYREVGENSLRVLDVSALEKLLYGV